MPGLDARLVPGVQPALGVDHLGGGGMIVPVPHHPARGFHQQFVILADARLDTVQGHAHAGRIVVQRQVHADDGTGLRESVALQDRHPEADEGLRYRHRQGGTATDRQAQAPSQFGGDLVRHQPFQQRPGQQLRVPARALLQVFETSPADPGGEARGEPIEYLEVFAHGVIASGLHSVEFV